MKKNNSHGISLIALIITIIVLIILAGVGIATLTGNNSILNKTAAATENSIITNEKEQILIAWNTLKIDVTSHTIDDIDEDLFENELNNNGNKTEVNYMDNDCFSIIFKDTTHEYTVDQNGNITFVETNDDFEDPEDVICREEYIVENGVLNENYTIDGWGSDMPGGKPHFVSIGNANYYTMYASWGGGKCGMYFSPKLDFTSVATIEADVILWSNLNNLTNTTSFGIQLDDITQNDTFDISETVIEKTSAYTEHHLVCDVSNITDEGYIKLYLTHGPESGAYTTCVSIRNIEIFGSSKLL